MSKKIMRYLKGSKELKLKLKKFQNTSSGLVISGYSDADWGDNKESRKSVSGGIILLNGVPVEWSCKKQPCVSVSTLEAEFVAGAEVCKSLLGLKELLQEIKMPIEMPAIIWMDNVEAIRQIEQESSSSKLKHVDMKMKFVCDRANKEQISAKYVNTQDQVADIFTKPMSQQKLYKLRALCGLE
jgi:hypothetical protein